MSTDFPTIGSDEELQARLDEALAQTEEKVAGDPANPLFSSFRAQLRAIRGWTAGGRRPTVEEVRTLTMGGIAVRELENTEYGLLIQSISGYVKRRTGASMHELLLGRSSGR